MTNREVIAERQAGFLRAVLGGGAARLDGWDPRQLELTANSLRSKRLRSLDRAWPMLRGWLADRFDSEFATYAAGARPPSDGGPLADGHGFVLWLSRREAPPLEAAYQLLWTDLNYRRTKSGLAPRLGPCVRIRVVSPANRLICGIRLPWLGTYIL